MLGIQILIIKCEITCVRLLGDNLYLIFITLFCFKFRCFLSNQSLLLEKPQNDFVVFNIWVTLIKNVMRYHHRLPKPFI